MSQIDNKRFRVFAGPNGSGKSSIIKQIRRKKFNGRTLDFGVYVNADEIAVSLRSEAGLAIGGYCHPFDFENFITFVRGSGLLRDFSLDDFLGSFTLDGGYIKKVSAQWIDMVAQILANYFVEFLLQNGRKVSYETVFSHESKVQLICKAKSLGYKVYLYFVCTDDPAINVSRVQLRVMRGGHDVNTELIEKRYKKSLENLFPATNCTYQAHFFDNSGEEGNFYRVANFKLGQDGKKDWGEFDHGDLPNWFLEYCVRLDPFLQAIITPK